MGERQAAGMRRYVFPWTNADRLVDGLTGSLRVINEALSNNSHYNAHSNPYYNAESTIPDLVNNHCNQPQRLGPQHRTVERVPVLGQSSR